MNAGMDISGEAAVKFERLRERLRNLGSAAVAFSSGVDSTFLLKVAQEEMQGDAVAVTVRSHMFPRRELEEAVLFCKRNGIRHEVIDFDELDLPELAANRPDRCYHCKKAMFSRLLAFARSNRLAAVIEGANSDDDGDFRPGRRAIRELGILSPLHEVGLTKAEIRILSRSMGLSTWEKPAFACLASRIPYGEPITAERLERIGRAEQWLTDAYPWLTQLRVRTHGDMARIETPADTIPRLADHADDIAIALKRFGFTYVALDLDGYRTGSMNERLTAAERLAALGQRPKVISSEEPDPKDGA